MTITDTNDPPYGIKPSTGAVEMMENWQTGGPAATLSASDEDTLPLVYRSNQQKVTFQLLTYTETIFTVVDNQLVLTGSLDYEKRHEYTLHIMVSDDSSQPLQVDVSSNIRPRFKCATA